MVRATQRDSFKDLKTQIPTKQEQVVSALRKLQKATNRELANYLDWEINSVTGRVNELFHKKIIKTEGTKLDTKTNRTVTVWKLA